MTDWRPAEPFVIAVDGPAASGKSSVGLGVAQRLGFRYFDTGLLYRVLTWLAIQTGVDAGDEQRLVELVPALSVDVDGQGNVLRDGVSITALLRQPQVDAQVSAVSAHPAVRLAMRPAQRALIHGRGLVMAGRDIGTVIVPEARLKIWLNASAEERARRRAAQTGEDLASVLQAMRDRDRLDGSRTVAPMTPADDAIEVTTDGMAVREVVERIVALALTRGADLEARTAR
jgi:cytidylate kinase